MATAHDKKRATAIISILLFSSALVAGVSIALAERQNNNAQVISLGEEKKTSFERLFRILGARESPLKGWKRREKRPQKESPSKERGFDVIEDDQMGAPKIVRLEEEEQQQEESL